MNKKYNVCLQVTNTSKFLLPTECDFNNDYQKWTFEHYTQDYEDLISRKSTKYKNLTNSFKAYTQYFT